MPDEKLEALRDAYSDKNAFAWQRMMLTFMILLFWIVVTWNVAKRVQAGR